MNNGIEMKLINQKQLLECNFNNASTVMCCARVAADRFAESMSLSDFKGMSQNRVAKSITQSFCGRIKIDLLSLLPHVYVGGIWKVLADERSQKMLVKVFFEKIDADYNDDKLRATIKNILLELENLPASSRNFIGFENGVFNCESLVFSKYVMTLGVKHKNNVTWTCLPENISYLNFAPFFNEWLDFVSDSDEIKIRVILAVIYMVLMNRYDWQIFVEISGRGGTGKSLFTTLLSYMVGHNNVASTSIDALDKPEGRSSLIDKSLILMPDQDIWAGNGAGIKSITGGDPVLVNEKFVKRFSTIITTVIVASNNSPMQFRDSSGGIARRRCNILFDKKVDANARDSKLVDKIKKELSIIVQQVMNAFATENDAKNVLLEQMHSIEALEIKQQSSVLIDFCQYLQETNVGKGMVVGIDNHPRQPRLKLYHAYLSYCEAYAQKLVLSVTSFKPAMIDALSNYSIDYIVTKTSKCNKTNVTLKSIDYEWLK